MEEVKLCLKEVEKRLLKRMDSFSAAIETRMESKLTSIESVLKAINIDALRSQ